LVKSGDSFETNNQADYEEHYTMKRPKGIAYPNMATMEKYGLKPQEKEWEI
jgi:hypothetical protein